MPSLRHALLATVIPRLRNAGDLHTEPAERARVEAEHRTQSRTLPTRGTRGFAKSWDATVSDIGFPCHVLTPRHRSAQRTLYYVHGGAFMAPIDAVHVRYATRLADAIGARVVMPDYPLAPEHTWADSHDALVADAAHWAAQDGGIVLAGDSAGGGLALAMAQSMRDRGLTPATHLVMHAPWVDLTTSTPRPARSTRSTRGSSTASSRRTPGGGPARRTTWVGRRSPPALADLTGLPRAIMLYGTRDLLHPGCRLLARRAAEAGWDLTSIEVPDLIHVYGLLPLIPEARRAFDQVVEFVR